MYFIKNTLPYDICLTAKPEGQAKFAFNLAHRLGILACLMSVFKYSSRGYTDQEELSFVAIVAIY